MQTQVPEGYMSLVPVVFSVCREEGWIFLEDVAGRRQNIYR